MSLVTAICDDLSSLLQPRQRLLPAFFIVGVVTHFSDCLVLLSLPLLFVFEDIRQANAAACIGLLKGDPALVEQLHERWARDSENLSRLLGFDILPTAEARGIPGLDAGDCWHSYGHPHVGPTGSGFAGDRFSKLKADTTSTSVYPLRLSSGEHDVQSGVPVAI